MMSEGAQDFYFSMMGEKPAYHGSAYGSFAGPSKVPKRKKMNLVAICLNVFVPWIIFCLITAMLSFHMHYLKASMCQSIIIVSFVLLVAILIIDLVWLVRRKYSGEAILGNPSWILFLCVSSLVAITIAVVVGNRNFWANTEVFYDITALNSYYGVDPSRMRGQEIMDAGRVVFVKGAHLDLNRSMGFKNMDTYCVAPITGGALEGEPVLASYDFWAVGKDCCTGSQADFHCGAYDNRNARSGVRVVRDEERSFYRLAVEQAQSAYSIKAVHPLFFHWVVNPEDTTFSYQQDAFKVYLVAMFAYFGFQLLLVMVAVGCFAKMF